MAEAAAIDRKATTNDAARVFLELARTHGLDDADTRRAYDVWRAATEAAGG